MYYGQINENRLCAITNTIEMCRENIREQGVLGIDDGGSCRNRQIRPNGKEVGCIVGLMVGLDSFEINDATTAHDLKDDRLTKIYYKAIHSPWAEESERDRRAFVRFLEALQYLHDKSNIYGFGNDIELVMYVLKLLQVHFAKFPSLIDGDAEFVTVVTAPTFYVRVETTHYKNIQEVAEEIVAAALAFMVSK